MGCLHFASRWTVAVYKTFGKICWPICPILLWRVGETWITNIPSLHLGRGKTAFILSLANRPLLQCARNLMSAFLGIRRLGFSTPPDIGLQGPTRNMGMPILRIYWPSSSANRGPYFNGDPHMVFYLEITGDDHVTPGQIVLFYLYIMFLEVHVNYYHSTGVKDIVFVLFFFHHLEPFLRHIPFQVDGAGCCCASWSFWPAFFTAFFSLSLTLSVGLYFHEFVLFFHSLSRFSAHPFWQHCPALDHFWLPCSLILYNLHQYQTLLLHQEPGFICFCWVFFDKELIGRCFNWIDEILYYSFWDK